MCWRSVVATIGLVAVLGMLQACCCCRPGPDIPDGPHGGEPWLRTGVVKAERTGGEVIGYFSSDPVDPWLQNWVLKAGVTIPIDVSVGDTLTLTYLNTGPISAENLCSTYGPLLAGPKMWTVYWNGEPGQDCSAQSPAQQ